MRKEGSKTFLNCIGGNPAEVPSGKTERLKWLKKMRGNSISPQVRTSLEKWYGAEKSAQAKYAEAFEICEYGSRPTEQDRRIRLISIGVLF